MNIEERILKLEQENKELKEKFAKLTDITKRYYDFWLHGTALEPIYKSFIDELEALQST